ncbi:MAG TPA: PH domain-containing protein [Acidimicrobiia bacterium]|nr:PH domain-containing protein [Acidimicrobiia bacterium]
MDWRPRDEAPYLSYGERTVVSTRLHPIHAVMPFIKLAATTYVVLLVMGLFDTVGTLAVLAIMLQWMRVKGYVPLLSFAWTVAIFLILLALVGWIDDLPTVVYLAIVIGLMGAVYRLVEYFFTTIYLTDRRIFRVSGILTRVVATMPLRALTDIRYDQTVLGRILDYGHFFVESAGQNQALSEIRHVPNPRRFYRIIMSEALEPDLPENFMTEM